MGGTSAVLVELAGRSGDSMMLVHPVSCRVACMLRFTYSVWERASLKGSCQVARDIAEYFIVECDCTFNNLW